MLSTTLAFSAKVVHVEYYDCGQKKLEVIKHKGGVFEYNQYYLSGDLMENGFKKNGMRQGKWTRFDNSGNVIATAIFHNNVKIGLWEHHDPYNNYVYRVAYINGRAVSLDQYDFQGNLIASQERLH